MHVRRVHLAAIVLVPAALVIVVWWSPWETAMEHLDARGPRLEQLEERLLLSGTGLDVDDGASVNEAPASTVVVYAAPPGNPIAESSDFDVSVNGQDLFVYTARVGTQTDWVEPGQGLPAYEEISFAYFDFDGTVSVSVESLSETVSTAKVTPGSRGITPTIDGDELTFTIDEPGPLTIELNGSRFGVLHLFANPLEVDPPSPGDPGVIYYGPGVHTVGQVTLSDDQTVYIAGGAVVHGRFTARESRDITIRGRGILDTSIYPRQSGSERVILLDGTNNVEIEGIILRDPITWAIVPWASADVTVRNVKLLGYRQNTDGIDIVNSQDVLVEDVFIRTWDDNITVKGIDKTFGLPAGNVTVRGSVFWTDRAQTMEIGYETASQQIRNVVFEDNDILHALHRPPLTIHLADNAEVSDVIYRDVRIEDLVDADVSEGVYKLAEIWIDDHPWGHVGGGPLGEVRNVRYERIAVSDATLHPDFEVASIQGYDAAHRVDGVTWANVSIQGALVCDASDMTVNSYVTGLGFVCQPSPPSPPASLTATETDDTRVALSWAAVASAARYEVYRDGVLLGEVDAPATAFVDQTVGAVTTYTYEVAAVNAAGLVSPRTALAVTTPVDDTPPRLVGDFATGAATQVRVVFSEPMDQATAEDAGNYAIDGLTVSAAALQADARSVLLTTGAMVGGQSYRLTVTGVQDRAATPNVVGPNATQVFRYEEGLLAHWGFNTVFDGALTSAVGADHEAQLRNGARFEPGHVGSGVGLDGLDDTVRIEEPPALGNQFSLAFRLYFPSGQSNIKTVLSNTVGGWGTKGFKLFVNTWNTNDRKLILETGNGSNGSGASTSAGAIAEDTWQHVVVTIDRAAGTARFYIDGVDRTASTGTRTDFATDGPLHLGRNADGKFSYDGKLDELQVFDRVLSAADVAALLAAVDTTAPTVTATSRPGAAAHPNRLDAFEATFSEDVGNSLDPDDLVIFNETLGQTVATHDATVVYDASTHTAAWNLSMLGLPPAWYRLTLSAAGIGDTAGNALIEHGELLMVAHNGDTDLDGAVTVSDAQTVVGNIGGAGMVWADGDADGDGAVSFAEAATAVANIGASVGAMPATAGVTLTSSSTSGPFAGGVGPIATGAVKRPEVDWTWLEDEDDDGSIDLLLAASLLPETDR